VVAITSTVLELERWKKGRGDVILMGGKEGGDLALWFSFNSAQEGDRRRHVVQWWWGRTVVALAAGRRGRPGVGRLGLQAAGTCVGRNGPN
jgi:hypothetical protein